jgi:hypothetical protein
MTPSRTTPNMTWPEGGYDAPVATEDQRDSRERTTSAMLSTTGDLTAAAQVLYRSADAAPDDRIRHRLRALADAVVAETEKIRSRMASLKSRPEDS